LHETFREGWQYGPLNFTGDPDHGSGYGYGSGSVSRHRQNVPWRRYALSRCF